MKIISWIQQIRTERKIEESLEKIRIEQLKVWLKTVRDPADIKRQLLQMDKGQHGSYWISYQENERNSASNPSVDGLERLFFIFFALNTFENNTTLDTQKIENKSQKGVNN